MTFTPEAAGTMAQILAVLLLAAAFAPDIRGALSKSATVTYDSRVGSAVIRYGAAIVALLVIALDSVVIGLDEPVEGAFAGFLRFANPITLGMLFTATIYALTAHVKNNSSDRSSHEPSDDEGNTK